MSLIAKLKLVNGKRNRTISPIVHRRNKLSAKIAEQMELAAAQKEGRIYAPKRLRTITDDATGLRKTVETTKRVKEWFWTNDAGKINVNIRYGSKVVELAKGKNAVEVSSTDELIQTLALIKDAVAAGELDDAINTASDKLRAGFAR
jgi:hypothetical protein